MIMKKKQDTCWHTSKRGLYLLIFCSAVQYLIDMSAQHCRSPLNSSPSSLLSYKKKIPILFDSNIYNLKTIYTIRSRDGHSISSFDI